MRLRRLDSLSDLKRDRRPFGAKVDLRVVRLRHINETRVRAAAITHGSLQSNPVALALGPSLLFLERDDILRVCYMPM